MDYLNWCEDLGMQPIMAVWSGFALGGTSVAEADLPPYIQQAIDQVCGHDSWFTPLTFSRLTL